MRKNPALYEINTRIFIRRLSEKYGRPLTLATVPREEWVRIAGLGFDFIWLMGVWQRSRASHQEALNNDSLRQRYDAILPGWSDADVGGSPYAIAEYTLDPILGAPADITQLKTQLNSLGIRLILDFVPNHLARDHHWTRTHPEWFVQGEQREVSAHPDRYFSPDGKIYLAHGRDPYFLSWTDTVQVNFFSGEAQQAMINELRLIAEAADGVRCDMAMLALNSVFQQVWGDVVKEKPPQEEFWAEAIRQVKQEHKEFLFLAESYWGLEPELQKLGFDFTYDKTLYDKLVSATPLDIGNYLREDKINRSRRINFIENHDEPRAVTTLGREKSLAAVIIMATIPGMRLFHEGQLEGRKVHLPVQLVRAPEETEDTEVKKFYQLLLEICQDSPFHDGEWRILEPQEAWPGDEKYRNLLSWCWQRKEQLKLVVVNYSAQKAQCRLSIPLTTGGQENIVLRDELTGVLYKRNVTELKNEGLYIILSPWRAHIMEIG